MEPKTPAERLNAMMSVLDQLADAQGRAKCGYIWVLNSLIEALRVDVTNLEETVKALTAQIQNDEAAIDIEVADN